MKHKRKQQYSGAEISNVGLGQSGWIWTDPQVNDMFYSGNSGIGNDTATVKHYEDVVYWCGIKCYPTTDSAAGNTLLDIGLTPFETNNIDQSKADTPGNEIRIKLQSGQSLFGAFSRVRVYGEANASLVIYKG